MLTKASLQNVWQCLFLTYITSRVKLSVLEFASPSHPIHNFYNKCLHTGQYFFNFILQICLVDLEMCTFSLELNILEAHLFYFVLYGIWKLQISAIFLCNDNYQESITFIYSPSTCPYFLKLDSSERLFWCFYLSQHILCCCQWSEIF